MLSQRSEQLLRELFYGSIFLVARFLSKIYNPIVAFKIRGVEIKLYISHGLIYNTKIFKFHDTPLPSFVKFLSSKKQDLKIIDVGANVGDTACLINDAAKTKILCIEPSKAYYSLLMANTKSKPNIYFSNTYLGENDEELYLEVENSIGNAIALPSKSKNEFSKLDTLLEKKDLNIFKDVNILKTDTEGFDFKILRGAVSCISRAKPALFFEFHPYFLQRNGENPIECFRFIHELGYKKYLIYHANGFPIGIFQTLDKDAILGFFNFSLITIDTYFDILCLHESENHILEEFYLSELSRFPKYHW